MFLHSFNQRYERRIKVDTRLYQPISFLKRSQKCRMCITRGVPPIYRQMCWQFRIRASVVDVVAGLRAGRPRISGFVSCRRQKFAFSPKCLDLSWVARCSLSSGYRRFSPGKRSVVAWSCFRSSLYRIEVKNVWTSTSIPSGVFVLWRWYKHRDTLILHKSFKDIKFRFTFA